MFKVGDTVELVDYFTGINGDVKRGDLAVVSKISSKTRMYVRFLRADIKHHRWIFRHGGDWAFDQFKLVPKAWTVNHVRFQNIDDAIQYAESMAQNTGKHQEILICP